jgi:hemoglobin
MATLYENLGGQAALDAFVPAFYDKVLTDDRVSRFFQGVDMERQGRMLKSFLTMGFGGPDAYAGKSLRQGHRHLVDQGLNDEHFDAVAGHIKTTLEDLTVPAELVEQVMGAAGSLRDEVLNKPEVMVAPQTPDASEEPVAVAAEVTSEVTSYEGAEATPVKTPRARKTSGTGTARRKKAATTDTPEQQEVPVTAD